MGQINPWVFIIIGAASTGVSIWTNNINNNNNLLIFQYVGFVFITYGVARLIIKFILNNKNNPLKEQNEKELKIQKLRLQKQQKDLQTQQQRLNYQEKLKQQLQQKQIKQQLENLEKPGIKVCPHCGLKNANYDTICERCGSNI